MNSPPPPPLDPAMDIEEDEDLLLEPEEETGEEKQETEEEPETVEEEPQPGEEEAETGGLAVASPPSGEEAGSSSAATPSSSLEHIRLPDASAEKGDMVCVGGTFSAIHKGHEYLFSMAFALGKIVEIGLTSDEFASSKHSNVPSFAERQAGLERFLSEMGWGAVICEIDDVYGFALEPRFSTIVVSDETRPSADLINEKRIELGLQPLEVVAVPIIKNEKGEKLTSSG
ncbi:MAG: pantetheine-phosphate adenylyltransferase [Candidatus Diapherotrites archaeon]|nr:pantetheine-phosphate adenylyltransferase [Candidatus Diapherotrites archaeon]